MKSKALLLGVIGTLALAAPAGDASAKGLAYGRSQAPAPLEGSWIVTIRPVVCTTGADVPDAPPPVTSYLTFASGGTLTESTSNTTMTPYRSSGHGYWERTGKKSYQFAMQAFITSAIGPYQAGHQRIEQTVEMHSRDDWTSTGPVLFFDVFDLDTKPGLTPYRAGCARASGVRMF